MIEKYFHVRHHLAHWMDSLSRLHEVAARVRNIAAIAFLGTPKGLSEWEMRMLHVALHPRTASKRWPMPQLLFEEDWQHELDGADGALCIDRAIFIRGRPSWGFFDSNAAAERFRQSALTWVLGGARLAYAAPPTQLLVLRPPGLTRQLLNPAACLRAMRSATASSANASALHLRAVAWTPTSSLTVAQQAAALASAVVLVGLHGAALTNAIFMRAGGIVVEIFPYHYTSTYLSYSFERLGLRHFVMTHPEGAVQLPPLPESRRGLRRRWHEYQAENVSVDTVRLEACLRVPLSEEPMAAHGYRWRPC